jgi:hypothetical protein
MSEVAIRETAELLRETRIVLNMYGSEMDFQPGPDYLQTMHDSYREHMTKAGYTEHDSVPVTSGVDPTVRFVGSHISVLKPYLLEGRVPHNGYSMTQKCIRSRNTRTLLDDDADPKYGSFFTSLGGIAPTGSLNKVCEDVVALIDDLGIDASDIRAHVSSEDQDLVRVCQATFSPGNILYDTQPATYYQHRFGVEGMSGRNFNVALPSPITHEYEDVGNIIVIESDGGGLGVEIALGDTTVLKQLCGLDHILDAYDIALPQDQLSPVLIRKMKDAIMTSVVLLQEGLRPDASSNQSRILRSYCKALAYYRHRSGLGLNELGHVVSSTEAAHFPPASGDTTQETLAFIEAYDAQLAAGKVNSKEDEQILHNLGRHGLQVT